MEENKVVAALNTLLEEDPEAIQDLMSSRAPITEKLVEVLEELLKGSSLTTVPVLEESGTYLLTTLGLLNVVLSLLEEPRVARLDSFSGRLKEFQEYKPPKETEGNE